MKKFSFILLGLFIYISSFAQTKQVYCELLGIQKFLSTKISISIDYGQEKTFFDDTRIVDEYGKVKTFNSMVDAMNYMGTLGWKFESAYLVTIGKQSVYHWLLSKNIELEKAIEDITTKRDFKNKNNSHNEKTNVIEKPSEDELKYEWRILNNDIKTIRKQMKKINKSSDEYKLLKDELDGLTNKKSNIENLMFKHYDRFIN